MCEGKTHAAIAADVTLVGAGLAFPALHLSLPAAGAALATVAVLAYGAGPLNDIDLPGSTVSRSMGLLTRLFHALVVRVAGGHRHGTHSLVGVAVFTGLMEAGVWYRHDWLGRIWLWIFLTLILSSGLSTLNVSWKDRCFEFAGRHRDVLGGMAAAGMIATGWGLQWAAGAVAIGMTAHIAADSYTNEGCPWLWPLSDRKFYLVWPGKLRFREAGEFETRVLWPVLIVVTAYLVLVRTGVVLPGAHYLPDAQAGLDSRIAGVSFAQVSAW
jgi:membrane-bound metal-dependent hydrolase YbcI (DUF457 family)